MAIYLQGNSGSVQLTAPKTGGGTVDLSNYYTKKQTDERITESLSDYAKKDYVDNATSQFVSEAEVDAKIEAIEIPEVDLTGYATEQYVQDAVASVDVTEQLEDYALKSEIPDVSGFQTAEQVQTIVNNAIAAIPIYNGEAEDV